jgi:DNA-binding NarL/FixJ family response regulator
VDYDIQLFTVAIADANYERRLRLERLLEDEPGIVLLKNGTSSYELSNDIAFVDRGIKQCFNVTVYENEVARIKMLRPLVLVVNLNICTEDDYAFLSSVRRASPYARIVLLADDSIKESKIIQALKIGARGYLKYKTVQFDLSKAIWAISLGEAWVPRKMLGNIIDHMMKQ